MNTVANSNPVGEQFAEAILAAALALPLAFAVMGLKHSRLIRDLDSLHTIEWSSSPSILHQRAKNIASPMPPPGLGRIPETKTESELSMGQAKIRTNRKTAGAADIKPPGDAQTAAVARFRPLFPQSPEKPIRAKR